MPEYLSPGVYVEEVDTGSKPIEGVSTSTAGVVGVTERGPLDVPILVTSYAEFRRWFGEILEIRAFTANNRAHCFLPNAVDGFFINGGKRLYVVRVLPEGRRSSVFQLHDRGSTQSASTLLLRPAGELTGTLANPPALYVLDTRALLPGTGTLANNDRIRIGDGSPADYRTVARVGTAVDPVLFPHHVALNFPLNRSHAGGVSIDHINAVGLPFPSAAASLQLAEAAPRGGATIVLTGLASDVANLAVDDLLLIGAPDIAEFRFVRRTTTVDATHTRVDLDGPLSLSYPALTTFATRLDVNLGNAAVPVGASTLSVASAAGDRVAYVQNPGANFVSRVDLVVFDIGTNNRREARRIGDLHLLMLAQGSYGGYPAASVIDAVQLADEQLQVTAFTNATTIVVNDITLLRAGQSISVGVATGANPNLETVVIQSIAPGVAPAGTLTLAAPGLVFPVGVALGDHAAPEALVPDFMAKRLTAAAPAGGTVLSLNSRVGLAGGSVIRVGPPADPELATIAQIPGSAPPGVFPNAGTVVLAHALGRGHASGEEVRRQTGPTVMAARPAGVAALDVAPGETLLTTTDGAGYLAADIVRVTTPGGQVAYHTLTAAPIDLEPVPVALSETIVRPYPAGSPVVERRSLIDVEALDPGRWGDRLRVSVEDERVGLVADTTLQTIVNANTIRLASTTGVEAGTILELLDPDPTVNTVIGPPLKVLSVAPNRTIRLAVALTAGAGGQQDAEAAAVALNQHLRVRSREFRLFVYLLRAEQPARPFQSETIQDFEAFPQLSLDPRHSRYVEKIVGRIGGTPVRLADRRPEGESWYVRVRDVGATRDPDPAVNQAELESVRLGPETLVDRLSEGRTQTAHHALTSGYDAVPTIGDGTYIGLDDREPENRTGLFSLRNIDEISLVACPGQTTATIQRALIDHCESERYRFAVLDGGRPPRDSLADVQAQRQQFDTKYAALYHPWLLVPDPYPLSLDTVPDYPIPPSGHMLGIYARTDVERGVHKAPANEVVRGVLGLQRSLNKSEHDILNPYPVNINVIRDFRDNNRGIRVWGGRVITSDSDWKYVNVRRLLIFIEKSVERGLQWVVFEPNAPPLWARVRRSITNFLTVVWRNGALEGRKPEEGFYVKCDETTMTPTDIESGRLICLVGVAPVKPAEFVIIRIGLWTAQAQER